MTDWSPGAYERTAVQLEPVAHVAVDAADVQPGDRVLDVACGTGNALLAAAARGVWVAGVDLAPRLVGVARDRAARAGVEADLRVGDATALPFDDDAFDAAISVFGVIFAASAEDAASELLRVVRPGGRIVVTAWVPEGPIHEGGQLARRVVGELSGSSAEPPRNPSWGDPDALSALFAAATVRITEQHLAFTASSPNAWVDDQLDHHPLWLGVRQRLGERMTAVGEEVIRLMTEGNEDPAAFRTTSRYRVVHVTVP
ncbi:MAG: class I SAM-dependent methyltransferase [Solirubrobacteraceae bacterium MAG38_C4-C5]|nr:class I SAM-dependent methyltransferase [Candidatus Siliceabacter maunaloa]